MNKSSLSLSVCSQRLSKQVTIRLVAKVFITIFNCVFNKVYFFVICQNGNEKW